MTYLQCLKITPQIAKAIFNKKDWLKLFEHIYKILSISLSLFGRLFVTIIFPIAYPIIALIIFHLKRKYDREYAKQSQEFIDRIHK
jgi:hypothetical protein